MRRPRLTRKKPADRLAQLMVELAAASAARAAQPRAQRTPLGFVGR